MPVRFRGGVVLLAAALTLAACGGGEGAAGPTTASGQPTTFIIAHTASSPGALEKLADQRGFFKKHNIVIKYGRPATTGAGQIAQIVNGQVNVGAGAYTSIITATSQNIPVNIVAATDHDYNVNGETALATLVKTDSGISSYKGLEGKTVGVNSLKGNWEVALREAVAQDGGDPSKVKLVAIPFSDQVTALRSGRVDAVSTLQPFIAALKAEGYKSLGDDQQKAFSREDVVVDAVFMAKAFIDKHPQAVKDYVAALTEAAAWCNANPETVRQEIIQDTKISAQVVNNAPIPKFSTSLGSTTTKDWSKLLVKYGILKEAPPANKVQWSSAPL